MSTRTKSPLHPSALSLNDMNVGRRIIQFNTIFGIREEGRIVRAPYAERVEHPRYDYLAIWFKVDILATDGVIEAHHLTDLGVIPSFGSNSNAYGWNPTNFTVDVRKRALLPTVGATQTQHSDSYYGFDYPFDDELSLEEAVGRIN